MNFDPMTGEPLNFDPMTGQPIQQTEETPAPASEPMGFDPMTGQPINAVPGQSVPPTNKKWVLPVAIGGGVVIVIAVVAIFMTQGISLAVVLFHLGFGSRTHQSNWRSYS